MGSSSQTIPRILKGDASQLSEHARERIKLLCVPNPKRFVAVLTLNWILILTPIALAVEYPSWWLSVLTIVWVGTRQNVLAVLLHEQVHRLAFRSRFGDLLVNAMVAYPLMITLSGYRRVHMAHHAHYHSEKDPDYTRKQGDEWTFPQHVAKLLRTILIDLTGANTIKTLRSKSMATPDGKPEPTFEKYFRSGYYICFSAMFIITDAWPYLLLYWFVPLFTVMQAIVRWSAICEHRYDNPNASLLDSTPFIHLRWWERVLLTNLNFITYHVYHHLHPAVPWTKLPHVHQIYRDEGLVCDENVFDGFRGYLRSLTPSYSSRRSASTIGATIRKSLGEKAI